MPGLRDHLRYHWKPTCGIAGALRLLDMGTGMASSLLMLLALVVVILCITIIGIPIAWILIAILGLWVGYRVIRGWVALFDERPLGI